MEAFLSNNVVLDASHASSAVIYRFSHVPKPFRRPSRLSTSLKPLGLCLQLMGREEMKRIAAEKLEELEAQALGSPTKIRENQRTAQSFRRVCVLVSVSIGSENRNFMCKGMDESKQHWQDIGTRAPRIRVPNQTFDKAYFLSGTAA